MAKSYKLVADTSAGKSGSSGVKLSKLTPDEAKIVKKGGVVGSGYTGKSTTPVAKQAAKTNTAASTNNKTKKQTNSTNSRDKWKATSSYQTEQAKRKEATENSRAYNIGAGAAKDYARQMVNAVGTLLAAPSAINRAAGGFDQRIAQEEKNRQGYRKAAADTQKQLYDIGRKAAMQEKFTGRKDPQADALKEKLLADAKRYDALIAKTYRTQQAEEDKAKISDSNLTGLNKTAEAVQKRADEIGAESAQHIEKAKEGLNGVGRFAVDASVAGLQLGADMAAAMATGGGTTLPMVVRRFGSASQEARQAGAGGAQQLVNGVSMAALTAATNKMTNLATPLKGAFGKGVFDQAVTKAFGKLAQTPVGHVVVSGLSEASEDIVEDFFQPIIQRAVYDKNAKFSLSDALYDGMISFVLGSAAASGDAVNIMRGKRAGVDARTDVQQGNLTPEAKNAVTGQETASKGIMEQEVERLFTPEATQSTTVNTDPATHTPEQMRVINDYRASVDSGMAAFVNKVRQLVNPKYRNSVRYTLSENPARAAQAVSQITGINTDGFQAIITGGAVDHITKRHGERGKADKSMADINDIARMPYVLETFDTADPLYNDDGTPSVSDVWKNSDGSPAPRIIFTKKINGTYYIAIASPDSNARVLAVESAFINKKGSNGTVLNMEQSSPQVTPEAPQRAIASDLDNSIAPEANVVKSSQAAEVVPAGKRGAETAPAEQASTASEQGRNELTQNIANIIADKGSNRMHGVGDGWSVGVFRHTSSEEATITVTHRKSGVKKSIVVDGGRYMTNGEIGAIAGDFASDVILSHNAQAKNKASIPGSQAETPDLGAANAGQFGRFTQMQNESDEFHPINGSTAERTANMHQRAPEEVPTVNPGTGRNTMKTASTILNSSITSNEMAVEMEHFIEQGKADYDVITDKDASEAAQYELAHGVTYQQMAAGFLAKAELGQAVGKNDMARAVAAYNAAIEAHDIPTAMDLVSAITRSAHTSAQAVQAVNLLNRLSPEGKLFTLRRFVDKLNADSKAKGPSRRRGVTQNDVELARENIADEGFDGIHIDEELADNFLSAHTDEERARAWDLITTDIANKLPRTFRERANAWRYTAMLLNPTTHIRNIMGNSLQAVARTVSNTLATGLERVLIRSQSERTKSILTHNDRALVNFARSMYAEDARATLGQGKYSEGGTNGIRAEIMAKKRAFRGDNALSRGFNAVEGFNSGALEYEDAVFSRAAYVSALAQAMKAKGITDPTTMDAATLASVREYAISEAQKATYRNATQLTELLSHLNHNEYDSTAMNVAKTVVGDALLPFRTTPANILTTSLDYSPIGLTKALTYDMAQVRRGNMAAADMVGHLANGLTGTGILALGAYLASIGALSVGTGDDDKEEKWNKDRGAQGYALSIGDTSYTLDWATPMAIPLFAGAAMMEHMGDEGFDFDAFIEALGGMSNVLLETSMLSSLNDFTEGLSYAKSKPLYMLSQPARSYASQFVPTIGSKIASAMDDTVRKTYTESGNGQIARDLDFFTQGIARKLPGVREAMQPKVDLWGEEVSNGGTGERLLESFLSPGYIGHRQHDSVTDEIDRLGAKVGSSVYPSEADKYFTVNGKRVDLDAKTYTQYAKVVGKTRHDALGKLFKDGVYQSLSNEDKAKAVSKIYEYATAKGKQAVSDYKPGDSSFAKAADKSALPVESYVLYSLRADRDKSGGVTGAESAQTLQELNGISDAVRGEAWAQKNSSAKETKNPFTGALREAGIDFDTTVQIMETYRQLDNDSSKKAREKATEWQWFINGLGLTAEQQNAVEGTYKIWQMIPAKPYK